MNGQSGFRRATYIAQGEQAIGARPEDVIATTLGSCVAVCLWEPELRVGGMNHILLPDMGDDWPTLANIGGTAMDRLVNAILKRGADRHKLRAKVFGGASMIAGLSDIGARNARFALNYLEREAIVCDASSVGGEAARQVKFWPESGRARQKIVLGIADPVLPEKAQPKTNAVELF